MSARSLLLVAVLCATGCDHPDTFHAAGTQVDASPRDAACPADAGYAYLQACKTNADCASYFRSFAGSGTLYSVCFQGQCRSADTCVQTNAGAADTCGCGLAPTSALGCPPPTLCMSASPGASPSCVAICR